LTGVRQQPTPHELRHTPARDHRIQCGEFREPRQVQIGELADEREDAPVSPANADFASKHQPYTLYRDARQIVHPVKQELVDMARLLQGRHGWRRRCGRGGGWARHGRSSWGQAAIMRDCATAHTFD
jgi:hypothetical protein